MAKVNVGDSVYVPTAVLSDAAGLDHCFYRPKAVAVKGRSAKVQLPAGVVSRLIATSWMHHVLGIAIVVIGDFQTEEALLTPLSKSVLQFCRMLLDDSSVTLVRIRAVGELGEWWSKNNAAYSHIVLVGHGSKDGIVFGVGGLRKAISFKRRVDTHGGHRQVFISLCCETGRKPFAKEFSELSICSNWVAPFQSVHGVVASQFCQTLLAWHLLRGKSIKVSFNKAAESVPGSESFRLWRKGRLVAGRGS